MRGEETTLHCRAYCQQQSSRPQVAHSSPAPLTIAGAPRTILDSTHRTLNAYYTRAGARAHAQQARTEIIPCVSYEGKKRSAVNTRTEYDALRSTVIRCGNGSETFLACSVLQIYNTKKRISASVLSDVRKKAQRTHPYTHLDLPSPNIRLVYLTYSTRQ